MKSWSTDRTLLSVIIVTFIILQIGRNGATGSVFECGGPKQTPCTSCIECYYASTFSTSSLVSNCATLIIPPGGPSLYKQCPPTRPYCYIAFWPDVNQAGVTGYSVARGCSDVYYNSYTGTPASGPGSMVCRSNTVDKTKWKSKFLINGEAICDWGSESHGSFMCRCNPFVMGDSCNNTPFNSGLTLAQLRIPLTKPLPFAGTWMTRTTSIYALFPTKFPLLIDPTDTTLGPGDTVLLSHLGCLTCDGMSTECADMVGAHYPGEGEELKIPTTPIPVLQYPPAPCPYSDRNPTPAPVTRPPFKPPGSFVYGVQCMGKHNVCQTAARKLPNGEIQAIRRCWNGKIGCTWQMTDMGDELICYCAFNFCNREVIDAYYMNSALAFSFSSLLVVFMSIFCILLNFMLR